MDHYKHYLQTGAGAPCLLHIEQIPGGNMHFRIDGDPVLLSQMIRTAMDQRQDIAAAMIAAVCAWADEHGISRDQIGNLVKFHGK